MNTSNQNLTLRARELRKNMTKEEKKLWYEFLRLLPCKIHRQFVIGNYIVDFFCASARIIIELDGSQHFEPHKKADDKIRSEYLSFLGYTILRYTNYEIHTNFEAVKQDIYNHLGLLQ